MKRLSRSPVEIVVLGRSTAAEGRQHTTTTATRMMERRTNRKNIRIGPDEEENGEQQHRQQDETIDKSEHIKKYAVKRSKRTAVGCAILAILVAFGTGFGAGWVAKIWTERRMTTYGVLDEDTVTEYRDLMKLTVEVLNSNGVRFWASGGTAIGAFRNSPPGLVRWDDDMDLGLFQEDMPKVRKLFNEHPGFDLLEEGYWNGPKLKLKKSPKFQNEYPMDIFGFSWYENGPHGPAYYVERVDGGIRFPECYYLPHEIESPADCPFWDLTIKCPRDFETTVLREFGENIMTDGMITTHADIHFGNWAWRWNGQRFDMNRNVNDHNAYLPAMNVNLLKKIRFVNDESRAE